MRRLAVLVLQTIATLLCAVGGLLVFSSTLIDKLIRRTNAAK